MDPETSPVTPMFKSGPNRLQRMIDEELLGMEERFQRLKTQRNAHADISKLPDALVGRIFTFLANSCPLESWYKINLVCRHWRAVALDTVALWTTPTTHHDELSLLMLERSKMADLHIILDIGASSAATSSVLNHVQRIHTLSILNPDAIPAAVEALKNLKDIFQPRLRKIEVHFGDWDVKYPLLRRLSSSLSIALRQFDWTILPLPTLVHLRLEKIFLPAQISSYDLLGTLRDMPCLESFTLEADILSRSDPAMMTKCAIVELPRLSVLGLPCWNVGLDQLASLLSHMQLPRLSRLEIEYVRGEEVGGDVDTDLPCFMRELWSTVTRGDFEAANTLNIANDLYMRLSCYKENNSDIISQLAGVTLDLAGYSDLEDSGQHLSGEVMAGLSDPATISRLTRLDIGEELVSDEDFIDIFGYLPNVEYIELWDTHCAALTEALAVPSRGGSHLGLRLFRKLRKITFKSEISDPELWEELYNCLSLRFRYGVPIRELSFVYSDQEPDRWHLRSFRGVGVEIIRTGDELDSLAIVSL